MSVQVAVRVRPFNQREINLDSKLCVKMNGNKTTLLDLNDSQNNRDFTFDYSFWSHDGYRTQPDGMMVPEEDYYADQDKVYKQLGEGILDNAWKGYHCTLFAYGQTGSGKSYSVMGYKPNVGIVPIACRKIFERIQADQQNQYEVNFSMMEIYNEKVQDLLIHTNKRPAQGMKIRESPALGFYAEGLKKYPVRNFKEIEEKMDEGTKNRSVASTQMNANSSRAHTIVLIELKQKQTIGGKKVEKLSVMNLVDLAGSEKVEKTGAVGDRLKEASAINKSLSMLGMVISVLADHAVGKTKQKIPYRDSVLTKILKNALGGNSKTIMVCAISPAQDNFEETLSTLRYADQAKKIKNKAIVNESASDKLIRELRAENSRLNDLIGDLSKQIKSGEGSAQDQIKQLQDIQDNMNANNKLLEDQDKSEEERLKELQAQDKKDEEDDSTLKVDKQKPYLTNINEDSQVNGMVNYQINDGETKVGRKGKPGTKGPDVVISGIGIKPEHCTFVTEKDGTVYLIPGNAPGISDNLFLNGEKVTGKTEVQQNDRIIVGQNNAFLVKIPDGKPRIDTPERDSELNWDFVQQELNKQNEILKKKAEKELQDQFNADLAARMKDLEDKHARELQEYQNKIDEQNAQMISINTDNQPDKQDEQELLIANEQKQKIEDQKKEFEDKYNADRKQLNAQKFINKMKQQREQKKLEQELAQIVPKVNEMNLMAEELDRKIKFLVQVKHDEEDKIKIMVNNRENNTRYTWDQQKALDRYYGMLDKLDELYETGDVAKKGDIVHDPFMDFADPILGGRGGLKISPLLYKEDIPMEVMLYDAKQMRVVGLLKVHLYETDHNGEQNLAQIARDQNEEINDPESLLGKNMYIKVVINSAKLPPNLYNTCVGYKLFGKQYKTQISLDRVSPVMYNYSKVHQINKIDEFALSQIAKDEIQFTVYGLVDPNSDPAFKGRKDDVITFQYSENQNNNSNSNNSAGNVLTKNSILNTLISRKKYVAILVLGIISWILFMVQLIIASSYRSAYDNVEDQFQNFGQNSNDKDNNHYGFWRSFSLMLICSAVMMTYYFVSFIIDKCLNDYLTEFIQLSLLPAFIWFVSSIVWLTIDEEYQSDQNDLASATGKEDLCDQDRKNYDEVENLCNFGSRYQSLVDLTIYMLIFNTIVYVIYYISALKYVKAKQHVLQQRQQVQLQNAQSLKMNQY